MNGMNKVIVGLSGGVDSAVAAYLLKKDGYDVVGVTLRTWQSDDGSESLCCDIDDARSAAFAIGIDYYPVNCTSDFKRYVVDPFAEVYLRGMTPNPCIECNRYVKWDKLLYYAKISGAGFVATGHYASVVRMESGRYTLKKAGFAEKDQTYMLYKLTQEQLASTLMPLGGLSKSEVRQIAKDAGLPVASKPDSQEVCFVTDGSYADFIEKNMGSDGVPAGNFVDTVAFFFESFCSRHFQSSALVFSKGFLNAKLCSGQTDFIGNLLLRLALLLQFLYSCEEVSTVLIRILTGTPRITP